MDEAIHEARKALKKSRAVLRMAREALGPRFGPANALLRDVARLLSAERDAAALMEAVAELRQVAGERQRAALDMVQEELRQRRGRLRPSDTGEALRALARAQREFMNLRLAGEGFRILAPGLGRTYRSGRKGMVAVRTAPSPESFHQWRKRVKDLWYHARWLTPLWPEALGAYASELKRLSDLLGHDHDLAVLFERLREMSELDGEAVKTVEGLVRSRSEALRSEALVLGRRIYAERTRCFTGRLRRLWKVHASESNPWVPGGL